MMTNKVLFGLVGGGSAVAGLGTGFGVGFNTQRSYRNEDLMNIFYSDLMDSVEIEANIYEGLEENEKEAFLKEYKKEVCEIANKADEPYNSEEAKKRAKEDKALCDETKSSDFETYKPKWEKHFKNSDEDLKREWAEFVKHINSQPSTKPK